MNNESQPHRSFYSVTPAYVRDCKTIEPNAKFLYGDISALCNQDGYCWATNEYFAKSFEVDRRTIVRWLKSLKEHKFIFVETEVDGIQRRRKIWISLEAKRHFQNKFAKGQKCPYVGTKMSHGVPPSPYNINNTKEDIYTQKTASASADATALSSLIFSKLLEKNDQRKPPKMKEWHKSMDKLLKDKVYNFSAEDLKNIIEWVFLNSFWTSVIKSPDGLARNIERILDQMKEEKSKPCTENLVLKNLQKAKAIADRFPNRPDINVSKEFIEFTEGSYIKPIWYKQADFEQQCQKEMDRRKLSYKGIL